MGAISGPAGHAGGWVDIHDQNCRIYSGRAIGLLRTVDVRLLTLLTCSVVMAVGCTSDHKKVKDADEAARSWAATVKVVTEQWAQSRVSLRVTRTTLNTAIGDLYRRAESIRAIDPEEA